MRLIYIGLVILATTGCSNNKTITQTNETTTRQYSNVLHPVKESTVALMDQNRAGAAMVMGGYTLVVATERATEILEDKPVKATTAEEAAKSLSITSLEDPVIDVAKIADKLVKSYSIYEMSRWERFCGHGDTDERDWAFVADQGRENLPESLSSECTEPAYTRQDYIEAWDAICSGGDTEEFQIIRAQTISPKITCKSQR